MLLKLVEGLGEMSVLESIWSPVDGNGDVVVTIVVFVNGKEYGENLEEARDPSIGPM